MNITYEERRRSFLSCLYSMQESLPGLLAMFFIALFSNNLAGNPNPLTLENLFRWLDAVIGPVNHQQFFQILNSNFVWNPFLMGLIIGNVFGVPDSWKRGLSYIHKLMPLGIIMLAPHFIFSHAEKVGMPLILIAFAVMLFTAVITMLLGKLLRMDDRFYSTVAGALSTGDPHVVAILMPMLKSKGGQVINALGSILLFGLVASFLLPILGHALDMDDKAFAILSVFGIGNTGQMFNSAFGFSYEAGHWAHYVEALRHALMPAGFLFVFFVMFIRARIYRDDETVMATKAHKKLPLFIIVFIIAYIVVQFHVVKEPAHLAIFELVKWDFSLAAAALGLSLPLREIAQWGVRGIVLAFTSGIIRLAVLIGVLLAAAHFNFPLI